MNHQLRIYAVNDGRLDDWEALFAKYVQPFHDSHGYRVRAVWRDESSGHFVWIRDVGSEADMKSFTQELATPEFIAQCRDIGVKVVEVRSLRNVVAPRF